MIIGIGELLLDFYPDFKSLGGATANFLYHLTKFGQNARLVSCIGNDDIADQIRIELSKREINTDFVQVEAGKPTGYVTVRILDMGLPLFNISDDLAFDYIKMTKELEDLLREGIELIYVGTLAQRNDISRKTTQEILRRKGPGSVGFMDLNLRQQFYSRDIIQETFMHMQIVKCNDAELLKLKELWASKLSDDEFCEDIAKKYDIDWFCVTRGSKGSLLYSKGRRYDEAAELGINVVDTVGAGDGFCALLALGYLRKWSPEVTLYRANLFAGKLCEVKGALPDDEFYGEFLKWLK